MKDSSNNFYDILKRVQENVAPRGVKIILPEFKETERLEPPQGGEGSMSYDVKDGTYSYVVKKGDTLGQIIKDLGIQTGYGLWGDNGDVYYYSKQLIDQGALDRNGNIRIGDTLKFKQRNEPEMDQLAPVEESKWAAYTKNTPKLSEFVEKFRDVFEKYNARKEK